VDSWRQWLASACSNGSIVVCSSSSRPGTHNTAADALPFAVGSKIAACGATVKADNAESAAPSLLHPQVAANTALLPTPCCTACVLVACRQVSLEEGDAKARELSVNFIETSAKAGFNIKVGRQASTSNAKSVQRHHQHCSVCGMHLGCC
jgi:hypothetical protein